MDEAVLVRVHVYLCWGMVLAFTVFWDYWWHALTTSWWLRACMHVSTVGMHRCVRVCICLVLYICIQSLYAHISMRTCMYHAYMSKHIYAWCSHAHTYNCVCLSRMSYWHKCVCMSICACMCLDAPLMYVWKQLISLLLRCTTWFVCTCIRMHVGMHVRMHACMYVFAGMLLEVGSHFKLCAHVACTAHVHVTNE